MERCNLACRYRKKGTWRVEFQKGRWNLMVRPFHILSPAFISGKEFVLVTPPNRLLRMKQDSGCVENHPPLNCF
jgi:hypothetical protein